DCPSICAGLRRAALADCGSSSFLSERENCDANGVGNHCYSDDFRRETQWARNINDRIDGEKNRGQRNGSAADCSYAQPDWSARSNRRRSEDRDREQREINDAVENVRGVIDQLKCFL